jgi:hypothetical protein
MRGRASPLVALAVALGLLIGLAPPAHAVDPSAQKGEEQRPVVIKKKDQEPVKKSWSVWAIFETHWKAVHDNYVSDDVYHMLYLWANYDPPRFWKIPALGRFSLRVDFTRKYVADQDESGILFGDVRLYYSRPFSFRIKGQEFLGRGYFYWTFPSSKVSQQEGNIARPTVLLTFVKELPAGVSLILRPFARLNWARYAEATGGMPNQRWMLGYDAWAIWSLPWHKKFGLGGIAGQTFYDRYAARDGETQPWNGEWFWEAFVRYSIFTKPRWPLDLDVYLNVTSGHRYVEDGVWRTRFIDRRDTELYLSIWAMY